MKNLLDAISEEDKECMIHWINAYARCYPDKIETVLQSWSANKKKLYKALGYNLRVSYPIEIKKDNKVFYRELTKIYKPLPKDIGLSVPGYYYSVIEDNHPFIKDLYNFFSKWYDSSFVPYEVKENYLNLATLLCYKYIQDNVYTNNSSLIFYRQDHKTKTVKQGVRTMRTIQSVLKFLNYDKMENFNKWRNAISDLNNARSIKCNLVFSIHPLDFMTMSDNACNWRSCMAWKDGGSYSSGTIEMLNSNDTIITYLESDKPFIWNDYTIPNKSWRCLLYVHKDILCLGKSYPYYHKELDLEVLKIAQRFLKQNLNWKYQYQYQQYKDLKHFYNNNYIRYDLRAHKKGSHNIFLYTHGMYADLVEDQESVYWCCRNWVPDDIKISVSGRATCMNCGGPLDEDLDEPDNAQSARKFCCHCEKEMCSTCGTVNSHTKHFKVRIYKPYTGAYVLKHSKPSLVCEDCFMNDMFFDTANELFVHTNDRLFYEDRIRNKSLAPLEPPIWIRAKYMIGSDEVVQC